MLLRRRATNPHNAYDTNRLLFREHDTYISIKKTYCLSPSPPPMTYRDLRSVMFNRTPSKFFFVPDTLHPPQISRKNSSQVPRKNSATTLSLQNHLHQ